MKIRELRQNLIFKEKESKKIQIFNLILKCSKKHPSDEGAESSNGITEAQINLKIALKVQNLLEQSGCTVILTRSDDNAIYDLDKDTLREKKVSDIKNRVKIGNESSADIFISIHLNKISESQYYGWQCFYKNNDENSKRLANTLQATLNETIEKTNDRVALPLSLIHI